MSPRRTRLWPSFLAAVALHAAAVAWAATRPPPPRPPPPRPPTTVRLVPRPPPPAPPPRAEPPPAPGPPRRMKVVERAAPEPVRRADPPPAPAPEPRREAPPPQPRRFAVSMDALVPGGAGGVAVPVTEGRTAARGDPGAPASAPVGDNVPFATRPVDATEVERPPTVLRPFTAAELRDVYPEEARREGLEADVRVELLVSEAGAVVDLKVPRRAGNGFDEAARTLARRIAFRPAERNGRAVAVWIPFTIKFRLDG